MSDNSITWLETTSQCNLSCFGCYRKNTKDSHKTLEQVKQELDFLQSQTKTDCISIAGGDPLLYPNILELVAEIKLRGLKPVINTNGIALIKELLHELKKAGIFGFTFHIDSKQGRGREAKWLGKNEAELNDLRTLYGDRICWSDCCIIADTYSFWRSFLSTSSARFSNCRTIIRIISIGSCSVNSVLPFWIRCSIC